MAGDVVMIGNRVCLCCNRREYRIDHSYVGPIHRDSAGGNIRRAKELAARERELMSWYAS